MRKYYLIAELLIFKQRRPNISVSNNWRIHYFSQDNAPAQRAREALQLLTCETPDFIAPALWQANSRELNPVDYQIWGKLQDHVCRSRVHDVDQLKSHLIEEWVDFHQMFTDEAIRQWRPRLRACIRAHGRHFEQRL